MADPKLVVAEIKRIKCMCERDVRCECGTRISFTEHESFSRKHCVGCGRPYTIEELLRLPSA